MQAKLKSRLSLKWQWVLWLLLAAILVWARSLLWQAVLQLFFGMLVSLAALPMMKWYEKKLPPAIAASLAMVSLSALLIALLLLLVPPIVSQGRQLAGMLPALYTRVEEWVRIGQTWLAQNGMPVNEELKSGVLSKGQELLGGAAPAVVQWLGSAAGSMSKWMLAPVFAFYFLRDRVRIGRWLLMMVPVSKRGVTVRVLREMKREMSGYIRGQLMVSAVVGVLTAIGLLFCGVPAWLLLGLLMGVLELIPYVGPFLGGVMVVLFSLQEGLSRTLWALGVVIVVQQLEGTMLSPQLVSDATRLHPVAVLLCVMLGGTAAGMSGILLAVPLLLCIRAALRVISVYGS